jgi:hypothetical protein
MGHFAANQHILMSRIYAQNSKYSNTKAPEIMTVARKKGAWICLPEQLIHIRKLILCSIQKAE